jgi:hypothetical protein
MSMCGTDVRARTTFEHVLWDRCIHLLLLVRWCSCSCHTLAALCLLNMLINLIFTLEHLRAHSVVTLHIYVLQSLCSHLHLYTSSFRCCIFILSSIPNGNALYVLSIVISGVSWVTSVICMVRLVIKRNYYTNIYTRQHSSSYQVSIISKTQTIHICKCHINIIH